MIEVGTLEADSSSLLSALGFQLHAAVLPQSPAIPSSLRVPPLMHHQEPLLLARGIGMLTLAGRRHSSGSVLSACLAFPHLILTNE